MTSAIRHKLFARCTCCLNELGAAAVSRRDFVAGGVAALGLGAVAGFAPKATAQAKPHRIDVHHHISPPTWIDGLKKMNRTNPPMANWSVQKTLEDMDKGGVATSITSPTTPQTKPFDKADAVRVARESNDYAKKLMSDHPNRFGVFAMLPLPHVDESLKEIAYAFDTLKVDGVGVMTSYGDKWLGYPEFAPVWDELNRRKATVYTHPTGANCCVNLVQGIGEAAIEYGTDTTRTIASLIFSGTSQKYKDINWIFSHGGGALTAFAERFLVQMVSTPPYKDKFTRDQVNGGNHPLLLRHRPGRQPDHLGGAGQARPDRADRLRDRFPVPDRGRPHQGLDVDLQRQRSRGDRPRERVAAIAAPEDGVTARACYHRGAGAPHRPRAQAPGNAALSRRAPRVPFRLSRRSSSTSACACSSTLACLKAAANRSPIQASSAMAPSLASIRNISPSAAWRGSPSPANSMRPSSACARW